MAHTPMTFVYCSFNLLFEVVVRQGIEHLFSGPSREQNAKLSIISVTAKEKDKNLLAEVMLWGEQSATFG